MYILFYIDDESVDEIFEVTNAMSIDVEIPPLKNLIGHCIKGVNRIGTKRTKLRKIFW